jgi:hypothetical protein
MIVLVLAVFMIQSCSAQQKNNDNQSSAEVSAPALTKGGYPNRKIPFFQEDLTQRYIIFAHFCQ